MREAIPPLPNTPSWRGAQLKKSQVQFAFALLYFSIYLGIKFLFVRKEVIFILNFQPETHNMQRNTT